MLTSNVSSKREQSRDFQLLCLHELNFTLFSLVELFLGFATLRFESPLQFSHSLHSSIAINWEELKHGYLVSTKSFAQKKEI